MAGRTYGEQNLNSFVVSRFLLPWAPPRTVEQQWVQLRDSGKATPQYVLKAPFSSAEPYNLLPRRVEVLLSLIFFMPRIRPMKTVSTGQVFSRFSGRLWRGFLGTFFPHCFSLLSFSSSPPGLEPGQNPQHLASGPHEAQALMFHWENSVRDTAIGKRWICQIQRESHSTGCGPSHRRGHWLVFAGWVILYANEWEDHSNN